MRRAATLLLLLLAPGCATGGARTGAASVASPACVAPQTPMMRSVLYFGLRDRAGNEIPVERWERFLADELTPRFAGLTVLEARGQWLGDDHRLVREPSRVVIVLHADDAESRARIAEVIRLYRARFDQESVLWESSRVCAAFSSASPSRRWNSIS